MWFRKLAGEPNIELQVFYCHDATAKEQADAGFGVEFNWDVSLLEGYPNRFLKNVAPKPGIGGFSGLDTPEIQEIVGKERFDAVLINGWHYKSAWQTMQACWKTKTPVMVRSDSHLHTERSSLKKIVKKPFYNWFIRKLDACLPVGKWSSDYFLNYGAAAKDIFIVPHVIDTDYFCSEATRLKPTRSELRAQWKLKPEDAVFLFAGKFIEKKRPLDFVKAIDRASRHGARVAGLMVGDGELREACETIVKENNLPVSFAGFLNQSRITEAYVAADALVLPSDGRETWGLVVNEAMTCGLPCFVSDRVGCGPDMIEANRTGAVFPFGDVAALAQLMTDFSAEPRKIAAMSNHAREIGCKYSVPMAVERTMEAVAKVSQ